MDRLPDAGALWALRRWTAGKVIDLAEFGHVFDGDFDLEVEDFPGTCVDDRDWAEEGGFSRLYVVSCKL